MPMLRRDMSVFLLGDIMRRNDFDEDFLEIMLRIFIAKLGESALGKKLAGLNDADGVAELFDFGHDMSGKDNGFAVVAALADEGGDGASGHDVKSVGGLVKDHDGGIVDKGARDGSLLHHAGGELVAAAVTKAVHVQTIEDSVDAFLKSSFVEAVEAAEVFDEFLGGEPAIEGSGCGKEAHIGADFFGLFDDVVAADDGGAISRLKNGGKHAQGSGCARAVSSQHAVYLSRLTLKADVIHGTYFTALFVLDALGQTSGVNHEWTSRLERSRHGQ